MFGLFKTKSIKVVAPVSGEAVALESVNDEVFSQKMVGDGIAMIPDEGIFRAPVEGEVSKIFSTGHAYIIRHQSGLEVMVHIGLDTVSLKGEGFRIIASEGESVKAGDVIIEADLALIESLGKEITTPVIISEMGPFKSIDTKEGKISESDLIMEIK
jgi:PTS system glucose-specific IIA component